MIIISIQEKDVVAVKHYSHKYPFRTIVKSIDEKYVDLILVKEFANADIMQGEPIVIIHEFDSQIIIIGGTVYKISPRDNFIRIIYDDIKTQEQKRDEERLPVSIYADAILDGSNNKRVTAIIKDISSKVSTDNKT